RVELSRQKSTNKMFAFPLHPYFVILVETKLQNINKKIIKSLWSSISVKWHFSPAKSSSGGIVIMWDDIRFKVVDYLVKKFTLSIEITYPNDSNNLNWWLTAVYGPSKRENRGDFWIELHEIKSICLPRWLMESNEEEIQTLLNELEHIDNLEADSNITDLHITRRASIKTDLCQMPFKEAQIWAKICKRLWNLEGGENSAFYHKICSTRQRRSFISSISTAQGVLCSSDVDIEKTLIDHFREIYTEKKRDLWLIDNLPWIPIKTTTHKDLCK
ncbi:hypothetical protein Csa_015673, partial [Cucumis sativus]